MDPSATPSNAMPSSAVSGAVPTLVQHAKLVKATQEFESILISELWKSARAGLGNEDDKGDAAAGTIKDMGIQAMAMGMAAHGGLGIGKMLLRQLEKPCAVSGVPPSGQPGWRLQSPAGGSGAGNNQDRTGGGFEK